MNEGLISWSGISHVVPPSGGIFVVDDDEDMREMLAATLAPEGFPVTLFEDGDSFLRAAGTQTPLCVFLDMVMPKRSGLDILKELRNRQYAAPIFLISARDEASVVVEAMKNGAHDYISKPFDLIAPGQCVRNAVELWSKQADERTALERAPNQEGEWFFLSPKEREVLAMMRMMGGTANW